MAKKNITTPELMPARAEGLKTKRHTKAKSIATPAQIPMQDEIELVAYLYSESRGFRGGSPEEDWLRAEQEVRARRQSA